jgi:PPOX class probable F420-dependent enzyme
MIASSCRPPSRRCTDVGVTLGEDELWQFLDDTHTGILTTLLADGGPFAVPVWFVTADHCIYVRTPARTRKVAHVRRDSRVCFTVEAGVSWGELRAVVLVGRAHVLAEGDERDRAFGLITEKYKGFGMPVAGLPAATVRHYDTESAVIRINPDPHTVSWDNRKLRRS